MAIVSTIIGGFIVGVLARLFLPGRQRMSLLATGVIGIVGALLGRWVWIGPLGREDTDGIDWIALGIGVFAASVLILIYAATFGRKRR